jgi:hypothetical protein
MEARLNRLTWRFNLNRLTMIFVRDNLGSPASVDRFRELASSFTDKATSSKESAISVLQNEGILTQEGNLSKEYR